MHPLVRQSWKSLRDTKNVSNSPRNWQESAKIAGVYDRQVNAPRGSSIVEITLGPKTESNSPRNGPEWAKTTSVYDRHLNTPRGSSIMEISPGHQYSQ